MGLDQRRARVGSESRWVACSVSYRELSRVAVRLDREEFLPSLDGVGTWSGIGGNQ